MLQYVHQKKKNHNIDVEMMMTVRKKDPIIIVDVPEMSAVSASKLEKADLQQKARKNNMRLRIKSYV